MQTDPRPISQAHGASLWPACCPAEGQCFVAPGVLTLQVQLFLPVLSGLHIQPLSAGAAESSTVASAGCPRSESAAGAACKRPTQQPSCRIFISVPCCCVSGCELLTVLCVSLHALTLPLPNFLLP